MNDLALVGGRALDPAGGIDGRFDLAIKDGRLEVVVARDARSEAAESRIEAIETVDASGWIVVPGLVDLHTHLYEGVSHYGIDADAHCLARGVTTAVDAGSSGAQTFPGFRRYVVERATTRIYAFLNVAVQGMISRLVGELEDIRWGSVPQAVARAREHRDLIVGIKVRLGYQMVGDDPEPAMLLARQAADELGLPVMCHIIDMRHPITWLLPHLGAGDIVTHCFHANEGGIFGPDGRLFPEVRRARQRGVIFDVGHGQGSFSYSVARAALAQDFPPDSVSSDLHSHNVEGPVFDETTTLSKLLHCGMTLSEVVEAATSAPAAAIDRLSEVGTIAVGREADLTALELCPGRWSLPDGAEEEEVVETLVVPRLVVRGGRAIPVEPLARGVTELEVAPG